MRFHSNTVLALACLLASTSAFRATTVSTPRLVGAKLNRLSAIAVDSTDFQKSVFTPKEPEKNDKDKATGAIPIDLSGIALSGLKGQALSNYNAEFPKAAELRAAIPAECFEPDTATSLGYLGISVVTTALSTALGVGMLSVIPPENPLTWPLWAAYAAFHGTVSMGLWVLAHECGHGAFSKNKKLQDAVGFTLHSLMLVPYFSWQRSHAVHHQYTNHMELGETHVPTPLAEDAQDDAFKFRSTLIEKFGEERGLQLWVAKEAFVHLIAGWPAYLLIGATGGPARGKTNHFYPEPLTTPEQPKKELFPGNWKAKVYQSDIGIAAVVGGLIAWTACNGPAQVMALYGGPLIIINAWLVLYTWLQHTDVDVPHFSGDKHNFVKGALHTIDRPYDKLDPFGVIDFLHHKIGTTHVAHHFDSSIPHYHAQKATDAIKEKFPEFYLYDPTPIPQALLRICRGCAGVEKRGDMWVWKNDGVEHLVNGKN